MSPWSYRELLAQRRQPHTTFLLLLFSPKIPGGFGVRQVESLQLLSWQRGAAKGPAMAVPEVPLSGTIVLLLLFYYYIWDFFSPVCVLHTVRCANAGQKTALVRG